ncbi:hypothetical protein, partial [Pandoraea communis]|uniref:hypothetical protein n=1 Tax=Pandoraea communis TaxID=2508297 RepID=UPI001C2D7666
MQKHSDLILNPRNRFFVDLREIPINLKFNFRLIPIKRTSSSEISQSRKKCGTQTTDNGAKQVVSHRHIPSRRHVVSNTFHFREKGRRHYRAPKIKKPSHPFRHDGFFVFNADERRDALAACVDAPAQKRYFAEIPPPSALSPLRTLTLPPTR